MKLKLPQLGSVNSASVAVHATLRRMSQYDDATMVLIKVSRQTEYKPSGDKIGRAGGRLEIFSGDLS
jgi:hypothetical protein